jgi:hypothetical protein
MVEHMPRLLRIQFNKLVVACESVIARKKGKEKSWRNPKPIIKDKTKPAKTGIRRNRRHRKNPKTTTVI